MKTIRRNARKQIAAIFDNATACRSFTLENSFTGAEVPIECARKAYDTYDFARLGAMGHGSYQVRVHSNRWYDIESPGAADALVSLVPGLI